MVSTDVHDSVSAESYKRSLDTIHSDINNIKTEIYEAVRAFYTQDSNKSIDEAMKFASSWSLNDKNHDTNNENNYVQPKIKHLELSLQSIVEYIQSDQGPLRLVLNSALEKQRLSIKIENSRNLLNVMKILTSLDKEFNSFDGYMESESCLLAANSVINMREGIQNLEKLRSKYFDEETSSDSSVLFIVIDQFKRRNLRFQSHIQDVLSAMCIVNTETKSIEITKSILEMDTVLESPLLLTEAWKAATIVGIVESRMDVFSKHVFEHILKPLVTEKGMNITIECSSSVATLKCLSKVKAIKAANTESLQDQFSRIISILNFIYEHAFNSEKSVMALFGDQIWNRAGSLGFIIKEILENSIPDDSNLLEQYKTLVYDQVGFLESHLQSIGFSSKTANMVRSILPDSNRQYSKKKRQSILRKARVLLLGDCYNAVVVTDGTERCSLESTSSKTSKGNSTCSKGGRTILSETENSGYFILPTAQVSSSTHDLVELAHQVLMEACTSSADCANILVHTSRDIFLMFRAIIPVKKKQEIANEARSCMLFHNDCQYIAHHLLTIGHQYRNRLPPPLNQITTMVDMVPLFRDLGESVLLQFMQKVRDEIASSMKLCPSLQFVDSEEMFCEVEKKLKENLFRLNGLSNLWKDGLSKDVYNDALGNITNKFIECLLEMVQELTNVPARASHQIHYLLASVLEVENMFSSQSVANKHCEHLGKLRTVTDIIDESLVSIIDMFKSGALHALTSEELGGIARAFYQDSPERADLLSMLNGGY